MTILINIIAALLCLGTAIDKASDGDAYPALILSFLAGANAMCAVFGFIL